MFSGIVKGVYPISFIEKKDGVLNYSVLLDKPLIEGLEIGASVAVDGVCQTVTSFNDYNVSFQAIPETLNCTHFSSLTEGQMVNIERSLCFGDELGGHMVSGHVFTTGSVLNVVDRDGIKDFLISVDSSFSAYLSEKGFIAINGVSLTLGKVKDGEFYLHLIPETLRTTNLNDLNLSDLVNIEFDQQMVGIVSAVEGYLSKHSNYT